MKAVCKEHLIWSYLAARNSIMLMFFLFSPHWRNSEDDDVGQAVGWSTSLVQTEISQQLLDGSPWHLIQSFMFHTRKIKIILVILHLLSSQSHNFDLSNQTFPSPQLYFLSKSCTYNQRVHGWQWGKVPIHHCRDPEFICCYFFG